MKLGFYFLDTKPYGRAHRNLTEVRPYTSFTFAEAQTLNPDTGELEWWMHGSEQGFVKALQRAQNRGFAIHLNFQDSNPSTVVALAAPFWGAVELLDVEDEPEMRAMVMHRRCLDIDQAVTAAGLPRRPIGAVFTSSALRTRNGHQARGLDWIGVEAYVDPDYQTSPAIARKECRRVLREALDQVPVDKPVVVVSQAFARHGNWKNEATLAALQDETYRTARPDRRVTHMRFFNWGRKDGVLHLPKVRAQIKAIAEKENV
jgi:hypothetical protein